MIKADNGVIHIASGETSYVIGQKNGMPVNLWFGNRIEPDDDLYSLGVECAEEVFVTSPDGTPVVFALSNAAVTDKPKPLRGVPTLRGDETLELTLTSDVGVEAKLYYTPYTRGGIARRAVVTNVSRAPISLRVPSGAFGIPSKCGEFCGDGKKSVGYSVVKTVVGAYAYLTLFDGAALCADIPVTLDAGESFYAPETLAVFSDIGADGATRALHDVLREYFLPVCYEDKCALVTLELSKRDASRLAESVDPFDLGADVIVAPSDCDVQTLVAAAKNCRARAMKFGLRAERSGATFADGLRSLVSATGAEYVCISDGTRRTYSDKREFYSLLEELATELPSVILRVGFCDVGALNYVTGIFAGRDGPQTKHCLPLGAVCASIARGGKLGLKEKFDRASVYCPSYEYDEAFSGEGMRRAVRAQTVMYKQNRALIVSGDLYCDGSYISAVAKDKSRAYSVYVSDGRNRVRFVGLDRHELYRLRETGRVYSGAALANIGIDVSDVQKNSTVGFTVHREVDR